MGSSIKAMWTNRDIRNRILFTLFAFLVYRLGCAITVPDVNTTDLVAGNGGDIQQFGRADTADNQARVTL